MPGPKLPIRQQASAGGVVVRETAVGAEVALISVGNPPRWQLPKGLVDADETPEQAATREVREETGLDGELIAPLGTIEYWYVSTDRGERVRFHKFVHLFLFHYLSGDVANHDHEVHEARWFPIAEAETALAFASERRTLSLAHDLLFHTPQRHSKGA